MTNIITLPLSFFADDQICSGFVEKTLNYRRTTKRIMNKRAGFLQSESGQSMIELALALPILLLIIVGTLEVGKYFNDYLTLLDATREGARFAADQDYLQVDPTPVWTCSTSDFYQEAACLVLQNMHGLTFDPSKDDIVVSIVTIVSGTPQTRYPNDYFHTTGGNVENGWSYCRNVVPNLTPVVTCTPAASLFNNQSLQARITQDPTGSAMPNTAWVVVEIYHLHNQFLGLIPPGLPFLPQQVMMHAYTIMPVPSAAPSS